MNAILFHDKGNRRRGAAVVTVAVCMLMMVGFAALTVDVGMMFSTKAELQRAADAATLAGAMSLANQDRLKGGAAQTAVLNTAREQTGAYANRNEVADLDPTVCSSDTLIGYLRNPHDPNEPMDFSDPSRFNAVRTMVRRDDVQNGPIDLFFASIFGRDTADVTAEATAALMDGIVGYRVTEETGNAELLPLALRQSSWLSLLDGTVTAGDNYTYSPATGLVTSGPDGIMELNLYPGAGAGQLPPGNFGTVDIGPPNNSTADISRQIREGVSAEDLSYFGGELVFGPDGTLPLNGDTGLSAGIKDDLEFIKGRPRAIPIFTSVTGNGNNSSYTVVGFVGIRIMYVKLTGSMSSKQVIIQPAVVVDDATIADTAGGTSYFVYQPVRLVR